MARRDVDVVIGARTDRSAFAKTEQETKGFLNRLRGGSGGTNASALDTTSRTLEKLAKVTAVAVAVQSASEMLQVAFIAAEARSAEVRGNMEQAANKYAEVVKGLQSMPFGVGPLMQVIERIENLFTGESPLVQMLGEQDRKNAEAAAARMRNAAGVQRLQTARDALASFSVEQFRRHELEGLSIQEKELHLLKRQYEERQRQLFLIRQQIEAARAYGEVSADTAAVEALKHELMLEQGRALAAMRAEHKAENLEVINKQIKRFMDYFRGGRRPEEPALPDPPFRPSLPSLVTGTLLTGAAAQSEQGAALRNRQVRAAEEAAANGKETNGLLRQLLQATRGQTLAPVLQNF